ncbi:MAG: oxidoreductase [Hydrogenophilales bacterium]|nr:oxidoreductase [Hydrogenophilales bacterium]
MSKPKFAMYWASACGGCEIAVLNIDEKILDLDANFEVAFWPAAMDVKYKEVEAMDDESILVTLFNGSIRTDENEHMAHLLRRKSKLLVAFGSCANEGCIPGLANLSPREGIFECAYTSPSTENPDHLRPRSAWQAPEGTLTLTPLQSVVRTLDQVVEVDYHVPGCPPESHQIAAVLDVLIAVVKGEAELPPKGAVLGAGDSTVCDECTRKRDIKRISKLSRIQELPMLNTEDCLLEQGLMCSGPATRSGCNSRCPNVGAPCIGCYGAAPGVLDQGARLMTAIASVVDEKEPAAIDKVLDGLPDPAGTFYRFSLAHSLLRANRAALAEKP